MSSSFRKLDSSVIWGGGSKTFCVRRVSMILGLGTEINVYPLPPIIQDSPPSPPYNASHVDSVRNFINFIT